MGQHRHISFPWLRQAFSFDGVDDFVTFGNTVGNFGTSDFTIDFWIKTVSTRLEGILGKRPICSHASFFDIRTSRTHLTIELDQNISRTNHNLVSTTQPVNDGNFHHVALVRQGTMASVYIDGVLDVTGTTGGVTNVVNSSLLIAGRSTCTGVDGTHFFTGLLDELEIFNRALSAEEIAAIFNAGSAGKCKGVPFADFTIREAKITFGGVSHHHYRFEVKGELILGETTDWIDPVNEDVVVTVGTSSISIDDGFVAVGSGFEFEGTVDSAQVKVKIKNTHADVFKFKVKAKGLSVTDISNPVEITLRIGDDIGTAPVRLEGKLKLEEDEEDEEDEDEEDEEEDD